MALERGNAPVAATWYWWLMHLAMVFLLVGDPVPGINESHYLPKALRAWDSSYAPGDLFLESANSHGLFCFVAGGMSQLMPLDAVAWVGRIACWSLVTLSWLRFARSVCLPLAVSPLALASWILGTNHLNWAGEWAVGGFESKAVSYPFVLLAIADVVRSDWKWVWIWLGIATAWHPLVGFWAGLSIAITWLIFFRAEAAISRQLLTLCFATAIALVGVIPAASGLSGPAAEGNVVASQIHVFLRLAHHQSPHLFASGQHVSAVISLGLLIAATWMAMSKTGGKIMTGVSETSSKDCTASASLRSRGMLGRISAVWSQAGCLCHIGRPSRETLGLLSIAWVSVSIALVGLAIDLALCPYRPRLASSLLRFYWFRWSDVAVPLAWTVAFWMWSSAGMQAELEHLRDFFREGFVVRRSILGLLAIATVSCVVWTCVQRNRSAIPPADRRLIPDFAATSPDIEELVFEDWKDVCAWIAGNTPHDSLWLTPRFQQTFKWYARRAEVVSWKDVPQDNRSLFEWYRRYLATTPPKDSRGQLRGWTTDELLGLSKQFGFKWVLVDRRIQSNPPALQMLYPKTRVVEGVPLAEDRTYAVFRLID